MRPERVVWSWLFVWTWLSGMPAFAVDGLEQAGEPASRPGFALSAPSAPKVVVIEVGDAALPADSAADRSPVEASPRTPHAIFGFVAEAEGFVVTVYEPLVESGSGRLREGYRVRALGAPASEAKRARVIGVEPTLDFAMLRLEVDRPVAASRWRSAGAPQPGARLFAPTGAGGSEVRIVEGELAALNTRECYQESLTATLFQAELELGSDALGAPVWDEHGEIVALFTGGAGGSEADHVETAGRTHLLPITLVHNIYDSLKQKKSLRSPWTGFSVRPLTSAEARAFPTERGFRTGIGIEYVWPNSPADALGIRAGDVLLQFSHNRIASVADFQKWLYLHGVDSEVNLVLLRDGEQHLVTRMKIEERPGWARPR